MTAPKKTVTLSDKEKVTLHIQKLEPELAKIVETIRKIILKTDKEIGERIKWNNPSFYFTGEMQPFDPKEYKREIAVFNLFKGRIMLGRRIAIFKDLKDVKLKEKDLQNAIKEWLTLIDK